jgi:hypothetical protein
MSCSSSGAEEVSKNQFYSSFARTVRNRLALTTDDPAGVVAWSAVASSPFTRIDRHGSHARRGFRPRVVAFTQLACLSV